MAVSLFPLQTESVSFGEEVFFKLLDHVFGAGVLGLSDLQVIQNPAGANLSVTVKNGDVYVAMTNGGKRLAWITADTNSGAPGALNTDDWLATFSAAHASNPRIDAVVLTAQDSLTDGGSGQYRARLQVVAGTPTTGADLENLTGKPATPANSVLLAYVLVSAGATSIVTAKISDQRPRSTNGGGAAQSSSAIPGELRIWANEVLPDSAEYGRWTWADGSVFDEADHPRTASNTSVNWKTHNGKADPGEGRFRVPDMRGASPIGLDDMGTGAAGRMSRTGASTVAAAIGEENHALGSAELASHAHGNGSLVAASVVATGTTYGAGGHGHSVSGVNRETANLGLVGGGVDVPNVLIAPAAGGTAIGMSAAAIGDHTHGVVCNAHGHGVTGETSSAGSGAAHNNVQPSNVVPFIVKLDD